MVFKAFNLCISWRTTSCQLSVADYLKYHSYLPHFKNVSSVCNLRINDAVKTMEPHKTDKNMAAGAQCNTVSHQTMLNNTSIMAIKSSNMDWLIEEATDTKLHPKKCQSCDVEGNSAHWSDHSQCPHYLQTLTSPTSESWKIRAVLEKSWTLISLGRSCSLIMSVVAGISQTLSICLT